MQALTCWNTLKKQSPPSHLTTLFAPKHHPAPPPSGPVSQHVPNVHRRTLRGGGPVTAPRSWIQESPRLRLARTTLHHWIWNLWFRVWDVGIKSFKHSPHPGLGFRPLTFGVPQLWQHGAVKSFWGLGLGIWGWGLGFGVWAIHVLLSCFNLTNVVLMFTPRLASLITYSFRV